MKYFVLIILLALTFTAHNCFATPEVEENIFENEKSFNDATYCINGNNLFVIGSYFTPVGTFGYQFHFFVQLFDCSQERISYIKSMTYECKDINNERFSANISKNSSVTPNTFGGFDFWCSSSNQGYSYQPKFYSFDENMNVLAENIDSLSEYTRPLFPTPIPPTTLLNDKSTALLYIENNKNSSFYGGLVANIYDSLANFTKQVTILNLEPSILPQIKNLLKINILYSGVKDVKVSPKDELYVLSNISYDIMEEDSTTSTKKTNALMKFNKQFELVWIKTEQDFEANNTLYIQDFQIDKNDNVFVCGYYQNVPQDSNGIKRSRVFKLNTSNGEIINSSDLFGDFEDPLFYSLYLDSNDNIVVSGRYNKYLPQNSKYYQKYYIAKLDSSMKQTWEIQDASRTKVHHQMSNIIEIDSNHYFITGRNTNEAEDHSDLYGIEIFEQPTGISMKSEDINLKIFNTTQQITIEYATENNLSMDISLVDIVGHVIYNNHVPICKTHTENIDISNLSSGVYFVLLSNAKTNYSKKIKKEML